MDDHLKVLGGQLIASGQGGVTISVFDLSGSMKDRVFKETTKMKLVANALPSSFQEMKENGVQRMGLIFFSDTVETWPTPATVTTVDIEHCTPPTEDDFLHWKPGGSCTALVDALLCGIQMAYQQTDRLRRVVAMTDGVENASQSWKEHNRVKTKELFVQAKADGIFVGLVGFTRGSDKRQLEELAEELGIRCEIHRHDESPESLRGSISNAGDSLTSMGSIADWDPGSSGT